MKAFHFEKIGQYFPQHFAQRCANSQPNHLFGNIMSSGIGKR